MSVTYPAHVRNTRRLDRLRRLDRVAVTDREFEALEAQPSPLLAAPPARIAEVKDRRHLDVRTLDGHHRVTIGPGAQLLGWEPSDELALSLEDTVVHLHHRADAPERVTTTVRLRALYRVLLGAGRCSYLKMAAGDQIAVVTDPSRSRISLVRAAELLASVTGSMESLRDEVAS